LIWVISVQNDWVEIRENAGEMLAIHRASGVRHSLGGGSLYSSVSFLRGHALV